MDVFVTLGLIGFGVWFWLDSLRAREFALQRCRAFCSQNNVQLLDQSIHVRKIFPARLNGRLGLRRFYAFEFSLNGTDRYDGVAVEFKSRIEYLSLLHPDGEIIEGQMRPNNALE